MSADLGTRLYARLIVDEASGCWLWPGAKNSLGYGYIRVRGRQSRVHRVVYEDRIGPIPDGLELDHLCRVRHCCNPDHLEPVTGRENLHRSPSTLARLNADKTHCPAGHPYSGRNLRISAVGKRECRACCNESAARYRERRRRELSCAA